MPRITAFLVLLALVGPAHGQAMGGHGRSGMAVAPSRGDTPSTAGLKAAHAAMMRSMQAP